VWAGNRHFIAWRLAFAKGVESFFDPALTLCRVAASAAGAIRYFLYGF